VAIGYEGVGPVGYDEAMYGEISGNTIYNISGINNAGEGKSYDADGVYCDGCGYVTIERNLIYSVDYGIANTKFARATAPSGLAQTTLEPLAPAPPHVTEDTRQCATT
jgi:hypothetical protein